MQLYEDIKKMFPIGSFIKNPMGQIDYVYRDNIVVSRHFKDSVFLGTTLVYRQGVFAEIVDAPTE